MGSYFCCEDGLFCAASDIAKGLINIVFPELHQYNIALVTGLITAIIRGNFPHEVPAEVSLYI